MREVSVAGSSSFFWRQLISDLATNVGIFLPLRCEPSTEFGQFQTAEPNRSMVQSGGERFGPRANG